jgi:hypothetical protein
VPLGLFSLYRRGVFDEHFTFGEFKYILRIAIMMQFLDLFGHYMFKKMTRPVVDKYIGENEEAYKGKKKKLMDDYLIQKDYFKNKKNANK